MKNPFLLLILSVILSSCYPTPATFLVDTSHFNKNAVMSICTISPDSTITGVNIENTTQHFKINLPTHDFALLRVRDGDVQKMYWIYLDKGNTKVDLDAHNLYQYPITAASTTDGKELIAYYKEKIS